MCHFSYHSRASLLPGLYFFSSPPVWQWGAVLCLSALNHCDRLELGCPKMVAFTSQKHNWKSHLHCRVRRFLLPSFHTAIFVFMQQKMIPWIVHHTMDFLCGMVCRLKWLGLGETFVFSHHLTGNKEADSTSVHLYKPKRSKWTALSLLTGYKIHLTLSG